MSKDRQPLKWHGGKSYQAKWIISLMPPRVANPNAPAADDAGWCHYVEPYFGGGAVLLAQDPEGISEVVNDINGELTNFWDVLKSPPQFAELEIALRLTPCSAVEFDRSKDLSAVTDPVRRAAAFFVRNRQSRQALGKDFCTIARNRTRRGMNELPSAWLSAIDGLGDIHARLQRVVILNTDAVKVIKQQDGPRTLFYLDPPYLHETRQTTTEYGRHEMSQRDHDELLSALVGLKGRFLLSGYDNHLYQAFEKQYGWRRAELSIDNKASSQADKPQKTEVVWMNY